MATADYTWPLAALDASEASFAPVEFLDGTNVDKLVVAFDDSVSGGDEYRVGQVTIPTDIDTAGTITLRVIGHAKTVHATNNKIKLVFEHRVVADSASWDQTYGTSTDIVDDFATDGTQDDIDTCSGTVSASGFTANGLLQFRVSRTRPTTTATELSGDWYGHTFTIQFPLA